MIEVAHVITGLDTGGAELTLHKLVTGLDRTAFHCRVVSLTDLGPTADKLQAAGVPVRALGMRRGVPDPRAVLRLAQWLRREPPDVVQTWMYHADLVGGVAARLAGVRRVAWNLRQSTLDPHTSKRSTLWTAQVCARLSSWVPTRIVCCSAASRQVHAALGYAARRMVVIPNGFDLTAWHPDATARRSVRQELGLDDAAPLVGLVARWDLQKDHRTFVEAAARLRDQRPAVHFLLCGDGITSSNTTLWRWIAAAGLEGHCHLLGPRDDVARLTAALDVACSTSAYGEGFPNVLGEAMACGVPCVATDIGDARAIVGDTGWVVPPRDPRALAAAIGAALALPFEARRPRGVAARERIARHFGQEAFLRRYASLYRALALPSRGAP